MREKTRKTTVKQRSSGAGTTLSGYTPFQRVVVMLSFTIIAVSLILSAFYMITKYADKGDAVPEKSSTEPETEQTDTLPAETEDDSWDGVTLRLTEDAGQEYVDSTLFLGDSNFRRLAGQKTLPIDYVIGLAGKGITAVMSDSEVYLAGYSDPVTPVTAVGLIKPRRILMNFGTNDLAGNVDNFITVYRRSVEALKRSWQYADIIIMSIPALGKEVRTEYGTLTMDLVNKYNAALLEMCADMGLPFLNVTDECLVDPQTGYARSGIMNTDGLHLEPSGHAMLLEYYRTHALLTEDRRPAGTAGTRVVWEPEEEFDCDAVVSEASVRLVSAGYTMASLSEEGSTRSYSYSVPAEESAEGQSAHAANIADLVRSKCAVSSKISITWSDDSSGAHIFSITEYVPCTEHSYGEWTVTKQPTCASGGTRERTCSVCGHKEQEDTPSDPDAHSWVWTTETEATCTQPGKDTGKCSVCGAETERTTTKEHEPETVTQAVEPTCTEPGCTEGTRCSVCGQTLQESTEIQALGHDYQYTVTTEPTETEAGERTGVCSRCGDTVTEAIDPTG